MIWLFLFMVDHKTVVNGMEPENGSKLQIVHELTIGDNLDDEREIFGLGIRAAATPDGTIYVVDPANYRVAIFDAEGVFQRAIGRQGQGPGEFQEPRVVDFDKQGNVIVMDTGSKKMNVYKPNGEFLRDVAMHNGIQEVFDLALLDNGNVAFTSVRLDANFQIVYSADLYDAQLKDLKNLLAVPQPEKDWTQANNPQFWVEFLKESFDAFALGYPMTTLDGTGQVVVARSNEYKGDIYDGSGNLKVQFSKKFKPKPFVEEAQRLTYERIWQAMKVNPFLDPNLPKPVFDRALKKTEPPDFVPPLSWIFRLGDGFAALANWDEIKLEGNLEIFDGGGNIIGITTYSGPSDNFYGRGNLIYASGLDREDNMVVHRYRVKGL